MTLYAAPGRLTKITQDSITIAEGEKFKVWTGAGDMDVYYEDGCGTSDFSTSSSVVQNLHFRIRIGEFKMVEVTTSSR